MSSQPLVKKEKVVSNTPNDKSYPFTVEVIAENEHNALDKKLDFAPPASILEGKNNLQEETHANAAMVLNSTAVSWQLIVETLLIKDNDLLEILFMILKVWRVDEIEIEVSEMRCAYTAN